MNAKTKEYSDKVRADLEHAKSQLIELEARSKAEDEQVATDLINQLKSTHQKIEEQNKNLETTAVEEMEEEQDEIDAGITRLREGLAQLDQRLKSEPRRKVG
jgi:hypothetical protein